MHRLVTLIIVAVSLVGCGSAKSQPAAPDPQMVSQAAQTAIASMPTPVPVEVTRIVEVPEKCPLR